MFGLDSVGGGLVYPGEAYRENMCFKQKSAYAFALDAAGYVFVS